MSRTNDKADRIPSFWMSIGYKNTCFVFAMAIENLVLVVFFFFDQRGGSAFFPTQCRKTLAPGENKGLSRRNRMTSSTRQIWDIGKR